MKTHYLLAAFLLGSALTACAAPSGSTPSTAIAVQTTIVLPTTTAVLPTATAVQPTATALPPTGIVNQPTATPVDPSLEEAAQVVRDMLDAFPTGQVQPFLAQRLREQAEQGRPVHQLLGLAPMAWQSYSVGATQDPAFETFVVPATLVYPTYIEEREFTMALEDGWKIYHSELVSSTPTDPAAQPTEEQLIRNTVADFINFLHTGQYAAAATLYGGDYAILQSYNPDITGDVADLAVQAQLLERACTVNGFLCLQQRRIIDVETQDQSTFVVYVELNNPDGSQYSNPANGGNPFGFRVRQVDGQLVVLDIPFSS